jgi:hypothetical protein
MSKTRFFVVPLATLIIIGLLILGGVAVHRIGWSQGYTMGQLAAGGEEGVTVPYVPFGLGYPGGLLLTIGLFFLLLIVIGKFFRFFWAWKMFGGPWMMAEGPKGERWARHWHRPPHPPMPPWCWDWEKPSEAETEAEPDAEAGAAQP